MTDKPKAKAGRPSKFTESLAMRILELAKTGMTDAQMAAALGIGVSTLLTWKAGRKDFREALKAAKDVADELVEASLYQRACGYRHPAVKFFLSKQGDILTAEYEEVHAPDTTACIFWLKNRKPSEWRDKQEVDVSLVEPFIVHRRDGSKVIMGAEKKEKED